MKGGSKLFIFTGIALALVTVLLAITMTGGDDDTKAVDETNVRVIRAAVDFDPHTVIGMSDIVIEELPADQVPTDAATDSKQVLGMSYGLGATKGDILLSSYLEPPGITSQIAPGKRAFSLALDEREMMSGLVMDGDYVDVIFDARIDLNRILNIQGLEVNEDGEYIIKFEDEDEKDEDPTNDDESAPEDDEDDGDIIPGIEPQGYQGKPDTQFTITDEGGQLEPATKIMVQDVKVIRVVKAGITYDSQGQQVDPGADAGPGGDSSKLGQLILEVTPQQAEALSFMQQSPEDQYRYHDVEVIVRGKDDHEVANTTGITFEILVNDETWSLPYPKPMVAPEEDV
jgi:hypothetical protein